MKILLSDICSLCCPNKIKNKEMPPQIAERVKNRVLSQIEGKKKPHRYMPVKIIVIAAVFVTLLSGAAFALAQYTMSYEKVSGPIKTESVVYDDNGEIIQSRKGFITEPGMILSINGSEEDYYLPEFRCYYLPSEPDSGITDQEGWASHLCNGAGGSDFPYFIGISSLHKGENNFVICGKPEIIDEKYWDDWYVLSISSDFSESKTYYYKNDRVNYVLLLNETNGWLITVMGTDSIETLEKIAANLEIRQSEQLAVSEARGSSYSLLVPVLG